MKYKVVRKRYVRYEDGEYVVYQPGDLLEVEENELERFGDRFIEAEEPDNKELTEESANVEICGAEKADESICERPVEECFYHES